MGVIRVPHPPRKETRPPLSGVPAAGPRAPSAGIPPSPSAPVCGDGSVLGISTMRASQPLGRQTGTEYWYVKKKAWDACVSWAVFRVVMRRSCFFRSFLFFFSFFTHAPPAWPPSRPGCPRASISRPSARPRFSPCEPWHGQRPGERRPAFA